MADVMDVVQDWNELHLAVSLRNQALRGAAETHPDFDGEHCVDCDAAVEEERLALQRVRCAECAHHQERIFDAQRRNGRPS